MAIPPITYSAGRESRHHSRRQSLSRRFSSNAQSGPALETPRTLCPKDGDAFSYDPAQLKAWYMPQELWELLPPRLHAPLAGLQHAGAAVLTGFIRLSEVGAETGVITEEEELSIDGTTVLSSLPEHLTPLPSPSCKRHNSARHDSFASSSTRSTSPASPISRSGTNTPPMASPISPYTLKPLTHSLPMSLQSAPPYEVKPVRISSPNSTPTFLPAKDPQTSRYMAELAHLRSEAIVRLRHATLRVDSEVREARRLGEFARLARVPGKVAASSLEDDYFDDEEPEDNFLCWWGRKKELKTALETRAERLIKAFA